MEGGELVSFQSISGAKVIKCLTFQHSVQFSESKCQPLLMSKFIESCVFQILNVDCSNLVKRGVPLLPEDSLVVLQPHQVKPLLHAVRNVIGQPVTYVQLGYLCLQPLPVSGVLDTYGSQVLWCHPGDGGEVIASPVEECVILRVADLPQPGGHKVIVEGVKTEAGAAGGAPATVHQGGG